MEFVVEDIIKPKKENSLWVEKYRPKGLDDYIGNDTVKTSVQQMIDRKDIPHLLLFGPAGTGKTTLAKMLVNNIPCDYIYLNASAENGIDLIRDKLKYFSMGAGFKPLKVVILDEVDGFSRDAQGALRNMMESYSSYTRFIMTCNHVAKMNPAIVSRCQSFEIKPISKKEVALKLVNILQAEKVNFTTEDVGFCVNTYYPDIRKVINFAQQSNFSGTLKISKENAIEVDMLNKLVDLLKNPSKPGVFNEIRQIVVDVDPNTLETLYRYLMDKVETYAKGKEAIIIIELSESLIQSQGVIPAVRDIPFLACMYKLLKHLK
jgi:replication factor C small subunit